LARADAARFNGAVELLPREEVTLLLGSLTACGFLILGLLEVLWPAVPRRDLGARASSPRLAAPLPAMPPAPGPLPPPPSPLAAGGVLLERARAEADLERRVTILTRAVAGLTRAAQGAPDDDQLAAMLATGRALLWETWEQIALARLAAAMPWAVATLSAPPRGPRIAALARVGR
jgi:hypothetical protein